MKQSRPVGGQFPHLSQFQCSVPVKRDSSDLEEAAATATAGGVSPLRMMVRLSGSGRDDNFVSYEGERSFAVANDTPPFRKARKDGPPAVSKGTRAPATATERRFPAGMTNKTRRGHSKSRREEVRVQPQQKRRSPALITSKNKKGHPQSRREEVGVQPQQNADSLRE